MICAYHEFVNEIKPTKFGQQFGIVTHQQSYSTLSPVSTEIGDCLCYTNLIYNKSARLTQPPTLCKMVNKYMPNCSVAGNMGNNEKYASFISLVD